MSFQNFPGTAALAAARFVRNKIMAGDSTTAGGRVEPRPQQYPSMFGAGKKLMAFEGDPVWCPACHSYGSIKCVPPFRPDTDPDDRQACLSGDLCICRCPTPPRLLASVKFFNVGFSGEEIAQMPGSDGWLAYAGHGTTVTSHDEHFVVADRETGQPVDGFSYGITTGAVDYEGAVTELERR